MRISLQKKCISQYLVTQPLNGQNRPILGFVRSQKRGDGFQVRIKIVINELNWAHTQWLRLAEKLKLAYQLSRADCVLLRNHTEH